MLIRHRHNNSSVVFRPATVKLIGEGGEVREFWTPESLSLGMNGKPTSLRLSYTLGANPSKGRIWAENPESQFYAHGSEVQLVEVVGGKKKEWFFGHTMQGQMGWGGEESYGVVALGPEVRLAARAVHGIYAGYAESEASTFKVDLPCIFNHKGKTNCKTHEPASDENQIRFAAAQDPLSDFWTVYDAFKYLVQNFDTDKLIFQDAAYWAAVKKLLTGSASKPATLPEMSVEGMPLTQALATVLNAVGFGYFIEPWRTGGKHRLHVYALAKSKKIVRPWFASEGISMGDPEAALAEVQKMSFLRDATPTRGKVTVYGGMWRWGTALYYTNKEESDLWPLWDTTEYDLSDWATDGKISPQKDASGFISKFGTVQAAENYHLLRSFVWNEDGAFEMPIPDANLYGNGEVLDAGERPWYMLRPRPVGATTIKGKDGKKLLPAYVEVGLVKNGELVASSWTRVRSASIMKDRAGFTITAQLIDEKGNPKWCPFKKNKQVERAARNQSYLSLLHNTIQDTGEYRLQFRLIGSVESDGAVKGVANPTPCNIANPFDSEKVVRQATRFKSYKTAVPGKITDDWDDYHERNDSPKAKDLAERIRSASEGEMGHGSIILRGLKRGYMPGDAVVGTAGRNIEFKVVHGDSLSHPQVVSVNWTFSKKANKTELVLDSPVMKVTK